MPDLGSVPIVSMRLHAINGRTIKDLKADTTTGIRSWVLDREYRVSFRDTLTDAETITAGRWTGVHQNSSDTIFISLSTNFADDMRVKIGDRVSFNVHGAIINAVVGSFRKVDFSRIQPNFLVLFPAGVLEPAPKLHVFLTRFTSPSQSARFQSALLETFPNVSVVDIQTILQTIDVVISKVSFIIRFMAMFSIITGAIVLISSVIQSKYQRMREGTLLRTLGASGKQILGINAIEYFLLGGLSSVTGILISVSLNMLTARFVFKTVLTPDFTALGISFLVITLSVVAIGLFNSRDIIRRPPLEVLRD
jgi:putative ABC transport system permease protein